MSNNNAELMRNYIKVLESGPIYIDELDVLEEGPKWQAFKKIISSAFSRTFGLRGKEPWIERAVYQYLRGFETVMRQYRQTYATLTWNTVIQFLVRSRTASQLDLSGTSGERIQGQPLTREDIREIFKDDRQLLANVLRTSRVAGGNPITLIPRASDIFSSTTLQSIVGGPDEAKTAQIAEVIVAAILEAAVVTMIEKHEGSSEPLATDTGTSPGTPAPAGGGTPAPAGGGTPAPTPAPAQGRPAAGGPAPGTPRVTPAQVAALRTILGIT